MIFWIVLIILLMFASISLFGAPYVPTHKASVENALDLLPIKKNALIVDLGSGDGSFLLAAAKRGYRAIGYEINPALFVVSWLRSLRVRDLVSIKLANFWLVKPPADTEAIFIFLAGPFMKRFAKKIKEIELERSEPLYVLSYGFLVPGYKPVLSKNGVHLYKLRSGK